MKTPRRRTALPNGFEEKEAPDGRVFYIDHRSRPPTYDDPRTLPNSALPDGWEQHFTPDGISFFVDKNPRMTWEDPRNLPIDKGTEAFDHKTLKVVPGLGPLKRPVSSYAEHELLVNLTHWRCAQVLTGYPDARAEDIDAIVNMLSARFSACPDLSQLDPLGPTFIEKCYDLISSQANLNFFHIPSRPSPQVQTTSFDLGHAIWMFCRTFIFIILLGTPYTYHHRLTKSDWIQWASSKRWTDQQQAVNGFLNSLISEWNLINLLSTLLLSASVGLLSVNNLDKVPVAASLISLIFSLGSLSISVSFLWRYQRQLTNTYDIRRVMNEFIYDADDMLSIFLSLPVAFLMWSVIWFAVGVVSYAWQLFPGSLPSPIGMTTSLGLVVFLSIGTWFGRIYVTRLKAHWKLWRLQNGSVGVQMEEQLDAEK